MITMNELLPPVHAQQNQPGKGPTPGGKGPGGQGGPGAAPPRRPGLTLVMLLGLMILVGMVLFSGGPEGQEQPLPTLIEYAKQGKLKDGSIIIETGRVVAEVKENATAWSAPATGKDGKAPAAASQPTRIYSTILPDDYGWIRNQLTVVRVLLQMRCLDVATRRTKVALNRSPVSRQLLRVTRRYGCDRSTLQIPRTLKVRVTHEANADNADAYHLPPPKRPQFPTEPVAARHTTTARLQAKSIPSAHSTDQSPLKSTPMDVAFSPHPRRSSTTRHHSR